MTLAVLTVTAAQLLDLGTFIRMIGAHGIASEANPFVAHLLVEHGLPFAIVAKVVVLSLAVAVAVVLAERPDPGFRTGHPRLVATVIGIAVVAGLVGGWTNAATLV